MNSIGRAIRDWALGFPKLWDRFWFTPSPPQTMAMIRIMGGLMLFYTHLVWTKDLMAFLGPDSWIPSDAAQSIQPGKLIWSHFWFVDSPGLIWTVHIIGLVIFAMLTLGIFTRVTSVLAFLITVAYCHRLHGALFGLDQVNAMLAMYIMIGSSGACYSFDRLIAKRRGRVDGEPKKTVSTNVAIRLLQLHMCIIYLFGGVGKMKGFEWWEGSAVWYSVSNLEYQSLDMTWMVHAPWLGALLTHITVFWEAFYCALVWPRLTRPIVLAIAAAVHGGIALFLGMITFGLAMLIGNFAFVSPRVVDAVVAWTFRLRRAGERHQSRPDESAPHRQRAPVAS
jgi:hypothetical protein